MQEVLVAERPKQSDMSHSAIIYWVFRHSLLSHGQHMMGARGKRSTETLLYFVLMLWVMALSMVWSPTVPDRPLLVSSWASNLISPIPKVGCTAVPSLARLWD